MAWANSRRNKQNPPGWAKLRLKILKRDRYVCQICKRPGADTVDHVRPLSQGGDHGESNLQAVHATPCHAKKTAREAAAKRPTRMRPPEPHPGFIPRPGERVGR